MFIKKNIISVFVVFVSIFNSCKKDKGETPIYTMQFEKNGTLFNVSSDMDINSNPKIIANSFALCSEKNIYQNLDSTLICFSGTLTHTDVNSNNIPIIEIIYCSSVLKNKIKYNNNNCGYMFDNQDFLSFFQKGKVKIRKAGWNDGPNEILPNGFSMSFQDSSGTYTMQNIENFDLPIPAYLDTFNSVEIVEVKSDYVWPNFVQEKDLVYPKILLTFKFKLKLYNSEFPNNEVKLYNGLWKGYISDNNYEKN